MTSSFQLQGAPRVGTRFAFGQDALGVAGALLLGQGPITLNAVLGCAPH
jgi:hypothetical protein